MKTTEKTCFKCLENKPIKEFYRHRKMQDGHLNKCKECTKKDSNEHRGKNLEKVRQYDKLRSSKPHRISLRKSIAEKYSIQFPDRKKANNKVNNAVRDGKLKKWPCMVCGDSKSVGHHADYDRPLDVIWLCQAHHKQAHNLTRKQK